MSPWQNTPGAGYYPGQQGYPYPPQQNPGYPPPQEGYNAGYPPPPQGGYNSGYPPPYGGPGFVPPPGASPPYGQAPPPGPGFIQPNPDMPADYAEDHLQNEVKGFDFSEKTIRQGFIRKVYTILMLQLLITLSMIALFLYHQGTKRWVLAHPEMFWICFATTIVLLICIACCTDVRRKAPMNFILLFLFTVAEGFLLATASCLYQAEEVMLAVGITAAVCLGLTIFAFQTKWDFTGLGSFLFVAVFVLLLFGIIAAFWPGKTMSLVYASIGALIFSVYLVYDTQMMIGGSHKYSISPEEYIFAALSLYIDVVNIFIYILTIIGASRD